MPLRSSNGEKTPLPGRFLLVLVFAALGSISLVSAWLAPNHYPPWTSFHGESAAFAALCCFCLARWAQPEGVIAGRAPPLVLAFLALIWIQWSTGQIPYRGDALLSSLYIVGLGMAWCLGLNSVGLRGKIDPIAWLGTLVIVAAVVSVFIGLLQWLRMEIVLGVLAAERGPDMRVYANVGQPNHLATLLLMATVFAAALNIRGWLKGWHLAGLVIWFSIGLTFTESRSALLAAFAIGALVLVKGRTVPALGGWRLVAAWWLLLVVLALLWSPLNEALYLQPPREAVLTRDHARQVMWRQSLAAIGESPWLGYGWRQTMAAQKVGAEFVPGWLATDYAHNIVLDILLWVGVPLGLFILGAAGWSLVRAGLRVRGPEQMFLFAASIPLLVHSLFEFPFAYSYFLFPGGWMLGALYRLQRFDTAAVDDRPQPGTRYGALAATLLFALVAGAVASEYMEAEEDYRVMRFELRRVGRTPQGYAAPELPLLTQLDELLKLGRLKPRAGMPAQTLERLRVGSASFGWATLHLSYAVALGLNGQAAQAAHQLALLRAVYGEDAYRQAKRLFLEARQQFPELAVVEVK